MAGAAGSPGGADPTELCFGPFLMLSSSSTGEWCCHEGSRTGWVLSPLPTLMRGHVDNPEARSKMQMRVRLRKTNNLNF